MTPDQQDRFDPSFPTQFERGMRLQRRLILNYMRSRARRYADMCVDACTDHDGNKVDDVEQAAMGRILYLVADEIESGEIYEELEGK